MVVLVTRASAAGMLVSCPSAGLEPVSVDAVAWSASRPCWSVVHVPSVLIYPRSCGWRSEPPCHLYLLLVCLLSVHGHGTRGVSLDVPGFCCCCSPCAAGLVRGLYASPPALLLSCAVLCCAVLFSGRSVGWFVLDWRKAFVAFGIGSDGYA